MSGMKLDFKLTEYDLKVDSVSVKAVKNIMMIKPS